MKKLFIFFIGFISIINLTYANDSENIEAIKKKLNIISPENFSDIIVEKSMVPEYYQIISKNGSKVYTDKEVSKFISGDLIIVENNNLKNITKQENRLRNKKIIDEIDLKYHQSLTHYPNTNDKKIASIYVFSDFTCPYCKKMHQNLKEFNSLGIEVYYIPFPRNTMEDVRAVKGLQKIMCAKDKRSAFDEAFSDPKAYAFQSVKENIACPEAIDILSLHNYADSLGVQGTPTAFTSNGSKISGFNSAESFALELKKAIDEEVIWKEGFKNNEINK